MPSHAAMVSKPVTVSPDLNVEKAIETLQKNKIDAAAVVDEEGALVGLFSLTVMMKNLLPVSVVVQDGIQLDIPIKAAPGIAKRLRKVYPLTVAEIMERKRVKYNFT